MEFSSILISVGLAAIFYIIILLCYKLMGSREISQLSIFDFVVNLVIADVAATGIVQEEYWADSLGGLLVLVLLQILMAKVQIKFPKVRGKIDGDPSLLIKNGSIDYEELTRIRIQLDELMLLLRQHNIASIDEVQYAVLENNGKMSVFEKKLPTKIFPLPLIVSGEIKLQALKSLGRNKEWLLKEINQQHLPKVEEIKYLFYEKDKLTLHTKTDMHKVKINPS